VFFNGLSSLADFSCALADSGYFSVAGARDAVSMLVMLFIRSGFASG